MLVKKSAARAWKNPDFSPTFKSFETKLDPPNATWTRAELAQRVRRAPALPFLSQVLLCQNKVGFSSLLVFLFELQNVYSTVALFLYRLLLFISNNTLVNLYGNSANFQNSKTFDERHLTYGGLCGLRTHEGLGAVNLRAALKTANCISLEEARSFCLKSS